MKKKITILMCLMASIGMTYASGIVKGKISDKNSEKGLSDVNIQVWGSNTGASSTSGGSYKIVLEAGTHQIEFSYLGFENVLRTVNVKEGKDIDLNIQMFSTAMSMDEFVVTASKTPEHLSEVPGRVEVISSKEIKSDAAKSADELLTQISGVNVDRSMGIFGKSVVSIRGIVGGEQGRILVLQDGIPINKSDGGTVNWNRINVNNIQKIEIFKGPGSSIYGSNAMGGVINILTKKNTKAGIHGFANVEYGTYNTWSQNISVGGKLKEGTKGFYWNLSANNRTSDGYIDVPEEYRDETIIKIGLKEKGVNARIGYDFDERNNLEIEYNFYDDERGQGQKIQTEQIREHDTHYLKGKWKGANGIFNWNISSFYQEEHYKGLREKLSKGNYTSWEIDAKRKDCGSFINIIADFYKHQMTFGGDYKTGEIDGADIYQTSTDIVSNKGIMNNLALYFQDKYTLTEELKITAGIRFDRVNFHDGEFQIEGMTGETNFMEDFVGNLEEHDWTSFTPKAAIHYDFTNKINTYVAWSKGFRAPTLDDLSRSGFISGGFKIANPNLGPETVYSYEWGMNIKLGEKLKIMPGVYYMKGEDFMYYLATGEKIFGGRKDVLQKQNITEVKIYGADLDVKYQLSNDLNLYANYTYTKSEIKKFEDQPELEGKSLTYTPDHMVNAGFSFEHKIANFSLNFHYQDKRFRDDENEEVLADYATFDAKLWKEITMNDLKLNLYLDINNLMDHTYMVYEDQISMGRFITFGTSLKF